MAVSLPAVGVRFQAQDVQAVQAAIQTLTRVATQAQRQVAQAATQTAQATRSVNFAFTTASGEVSAFGKKSLTALNATGFALSQLAASGQVSFRSLATSATSFLAFFGPHGAIAAAVISTGLIVTDFWTRQRREIEDTSASIEAMLAAARTRRERDEPVAVAEERLAFRTAERERAQQRLNTLLQSQAAASATAEVPGPSPRSIASATQAVTDALKAEHEALRQLNDAQKKQGEQDKNEVATLARLIAARRANASEIQRATQLMEQARFVLDATRNANAADLATMQARAKATETLTTLQDAFKRSLGDVGKAEEERRKRIAEQISAIATLRELNKATGADLAQLAVLHAQLNTELRAGNVTLERRAEILSQLRDIEAAAVQPVQTRRGMSTVDTAPTAPGRMRINPAAQAKLAAPIRNQMMGNVAPVLTDFEQQLAAGLGNAIANGITEGFARGFAEGGIAGGFKALAASILQGFGQVFTQIGQQVIAGSVIMQQIVLAMRSLNPWVALAAGVALMTLGQSLGGAGGGRAVSGGFGGGAGSGTGTTPLSVQRLITDPSTLVRSRTGGQSMSPVAPSDPFRGMTFLVVNGPPGRRFLVEQLNAARQRGL